MSSCHHNYDWRTTRRQGHGCVGCDGCHIDGVDRFGHAERAAIGLGCAKYSEIEEKLRHAIDNPIALAADAAGNLYIVSRTNGTFILKADPELTQVAQNRFESTINSLNVAVENLSASESRIRDTDMAAEMVNFTRAQILSQAGTAMLAQANQAPQGVLRLLQ